MGGIPLDLDSHDFTELGDSIVERTTMKTNNQDATFQVHLENLGMFLKNSDCVHHPKEL